VPAPTHQHQKHVITEVQSTTCASPTYQDVHPQALVAWYTALSVGRLLRLMRTLQMTGLTFQNRERKEKKEYLYSFRWSLSATAVIWVRQGVPPGNPGGTLGRPVLSRSCSRAEQSGSHLGRQKWCREKPELKTQ